MLQLPAAWQVASTTSLQTPSPATEGMYGGPLTTTFGPDMTIGARVAASTNRCPSTRTRRGGGAPGAARGAQAARAAAQSLSAIALGPNRGGNALPGTR